MRRPALPALLTLVLGVGLVAGCNDSATYVVPGGTVEVKSRSDGTTDEVSFTGPGGSFRAETDGTKTTFEGPQGTLEVDAGAGLDALGVELPPGCEPKRTKTPVATIDMPQGRQVIASLTTDIAPDALLDFYAERVELTTRAVVNDSAHATAKLDDGGTLTIHLSPPKPAQDGRRDLAVMVVRPRK